MVVGSFIAGDAMWDAMGMGMRWCSLFCPQLSLLLSQRKLLLWMSTLSSLPGLGQLKMGGRIGPFLTCAGASARESVP